MRKSKVFLIGGNRSSDSRQKRQS